MFQEIQDNLTKLYLEDERPWLVGFSGGKDSTMLASLIFKSVEAVPLDQRQKTVTIVSTDTRVEIPAISSAVEKALCDMKEYSDFAKLKIEIALLKPPPEQSFWVNIIGRGYPAPNRTFRWCTQRLKIDPVTKLVQQRLGQWGEAILHLGARRAESSSRAQTLAGMETRKGLRKHPDLPRVWVSNPIEYLSTEEVWAYLLQSNNPWGTDNRGLYKLYANASGGECPIQVDTSTPACGNSRFGCWTCTVVTRDKASEGLLAAGDWVMEHLLEFRETLLEFRNPENGYRDNRRTNGAEGPGPLKVSARKELLNRLLSLQEETKLQLISPEELLLIQQLWKTARDPDIGDGVARIIKSVLGDNLKMENVKTDRLSTLEEEVTNAQGIRVETLRRMLAKVSEYSESHRAKGLPDDLLNILNDDLESNYGEQS
jgi:DNA sulfur modification protein DndC